MIIWCKATTLNDTIQCYTYSLLNYRKRSSGVNNKWSVISLLFKVPERVPISAHLYCENQNHWNHLQLVLFQDWVWVHLTRTIWENTLKFIEVEMIPPRQAGFMLLELNWLCWYGTSTPCKRKRSITNTEPFLEKSYVWKQHSLVSLTVSIYSTIAGLFSAFPNCYHDHLHLADTLVQLVLSPIELHLSFSASRFCMNSIRRYIQMWWWSSCSVLHCWCEGKVRVRLWQLLLCTKEGS